MTLPAFTGHAMVQSLTKGLPVVRASPGQRMGYSWPTHGRSGPMERFTISRDDRLAHEFDPGIAGRPGDTLRFEAVRHPRERDLAALDPVSSP